MKKFTTVTAAALLMSLMATTISAPANAKTIRMEKNYSKGKFSIDGNGGARLGGQVYLWDSSPTNKNQQWVETKVDGRYYMYKKLNTSACLDGGNGGKRNQAVVLQTCKTSNRNQHWEKKDAPSGTIRLKKRGVSYSIDGGNGAAKRQGIKLYDSKNSNPNQQWRFFTVNGSSSSSSSSSSSGSSSSSSGSGAFGLDKNKKPWRNFDLSDWALDTPARDSSDGLALRTSDKGFRDGRVQSAQNQFFFTHSDGGMRFKSTVGGAKTSSNTKFTRSELREMLRKGDTKIKTTGESKNNWQMGYASTNSKLKAKGGRLHATLRVNRVTTSGDKSHIGRTIVGQIHASKNEPIRLYYRKLKNNDRGSIYWAHEKRNGDERYYELIGSRSSSQKNPSNGIKLNELWSYEINQSGSNIEVVIRRGDRNGSVIKRNSIDMRSLNSGYDRKSEWMYFKAGLYTQNNSGSSNDHDIATFYRLSNTH